MDRVRPVETALLIGLLLIVLNVLNPLVELGRIIVHISPVDVVFALVGASALVFRRRESLALIRRNSTYYLLSGLFITSVLLSALLSPHRAVPLRESAQLIAYLWILPLILAYEPNVPWVYRTGAKVLTVVGAFLLFPYFYFFGWVRFNPFNIHANITGFLFALFSLILTHYGETGMAALSTVVASFTFSRAALGSLFSTLLMKGFLERKRWLPHLSLAALSVALLFASPYALRGFIKVRDHIKSKLVKVEGGIGYKPPIDVLRGKGYEMIRVLMWESSLKMWEEKPLTGIGLGRFREEWESECREGKLPDRLCVKWVGNVDPHNVFLHVISETGIVGLTTFLLLFAFVAFRVAGNSLALSVLVMTFLFALLQPFPLFIRNLAPIVWLLLFYGGVIRWRNPGGPDA